MSKLDEIVSQIEAQSTPPVHLWKPASIGEIDIHIDSNGFWYHQGDRIVRDQLVQLFASILWCEAEQYFLVTPQEKLKIKVDDVPYVIQQAGLVENSWLVTTNTHEQVIINEQHPVALRQYKNQLLPYVRIRYELWARVNRSVYFQWVTQALEQQADDQQAIQGAVSLLSGDYHFALS